jgi:5,6-dimethylbenzimidazole synthase
MNAHENLWLAAELDLPAGAMPIGLLCLGPVDRFYEQRMLGAEGWRLGRLSSDPDAALWSDDRWPA